MNRLEKKCFIGSAGFHGLLLVVFVFGTAFFTSKTPPDLGPVVNIINAIPTDLPFNSGGNPNANPTPPQQKIEPAQPPPPAEPPKAAKPPEPEHEPVKMPDPKPEVQKKPEPKIKDSPKREIVKDQGEIPVKTASRDKPAKSDINTNVVRRSTVDVARLQKEAKERAAQAAAQAKAEQAAWDRYNQQRTAIAREAGRIVSGVGKGLTHSTVVEAVGPGGEAFVNYGSLVRDVYDRAWNVTPDLTDDDSSATARVTIRRDGTVSNATLNRPSANASLNKSVRRALDAVREIGKPFPEGARESERTFNIEFNLKTRRAVG